MFFFFFLNNGQVTESIDGVDEDGAEELLGEREVVVQEVWWVLWSRGWMERKKDILVCKHKVLSQHEILGIYIKFGPQKSQAKLPETTQLKYFKKVKF